VWQHGIIPGILTTREIADDVHRDGLDILLDHREVDVEAIDSVLINSKGFGGNNATASILAPHVTRRMLEKRHGKAALAQWQSANEAVQQSAERYHLRTCEEQVQPLYFYDNDVRDGKDLQFAESALTLRGYGT